MIRCAFNKGKLEIEDTLKKKVKNILMFLNIKAKLERGIKNIDNEHISIKEFKKITRKS